MVDRTRAVAWTGLSASTGSTRASQTPTGRKRVAAAARANAASRSPNTATRVDSDLALTGASRAVAAPKRKKARAITNRIAHVTHPSAPGAQTNPAHPAGIVP